MWKRKCLACCVGYILKALSWISPSRFPQRDPIDTFGSFSKDEVQVEWRLRSDCCGSLALGFETRQNNFFSVFFYRALRIPQETISATCEGVNGFASYKLLVQKEKLLLKSM